MRIICAISFLVAAFTFGAAAQVALTGAGGNGPAPVSYTGPGDVVAGARVWYGLRGYNQSYATGGGNPGVQVWANQGGTKYVINILANGNLDVSTALSDVGVSGSASCTISGTTMSCASGSGTLRSLGNLTGAGLTNPVYITGASCTSYPCTATLNQAQTVSVAETITGYNVIDIYQWYDQSGANACGGGPCNISGVGLPSDAALISNCYNTFSCAVMPSNASAPYSPITGMTSTNIPVTFSAIAGQFSNFSSQQNVIATFVATTGQPEAVFKGTGLVGIYGGSFLTATASDSAIHAMQLVAASPTCVINVDGTETSGGCGSGAASTEIVILGATNGNVPLAQGGIFLEAGMWPSTINGTNRTAICRNQQAYWGTGNFPATC